MLYICDETGIKKKVVFRGAHNLFSATFLQITAGNKGTIVMRMDNLMVIHENLKRGNASPFNSSIILF